MTNLEYTQAYADLRRKLISITAEERKTLLTVYEEAARQAGEVIKSAKLRGLSTLTIDRWTGIRHDLESGANAIANATDASVRSAISKGTAAQDAIELEYISSAVFSAGLTRLSGLQSVYDGINLKLINNITTYVYNGVSYSSRVWGGAGVAGDWLKRVRLMTSAGLAQGRDPVKIARDLQQYVRQGPRVIGQWGTLLPGTREYVQRLGKSGVDYRALRIVRTELHNGIRTTAIENAEVNPAWNGKYNWILASGRVNWPCDCPELAAGSPYTKDNVPRETHPNCMCRIEAEMIDRATFLQQLKDYRDGVDNAGANAINTWAKKYNLEVE